MAGLPHSLPLAASIVLASRENDKKFALYPINTVTGRVGPAITEPVDNLQNPLISPDRGSIIYLQADSTGGTIRTAAADGTGDRQLFARPPTCGQNRPAGVEPEEHPTAGHFVHGHEVPPRQSAVGESERKGRTGPFPPMV